MIKKYCPLLLLIFFVNISFSQTTLTAGDVVITGYNSDGDDQIAFVLLTDITTGTEIKFTDRGWLSTNAFRVGDPDREGTLIWTANTDLFCGTQITIQSANNGTLTIIPNIGTLSEADDFEFRGNGDQIIVYQGLDTNPTFIYALNYNDPDWTATAGNQQESAIPIGLTNGVNSINIGGDDDNGTYDCSVSSQASLILSSISDASNWNTTDGGGNQSLTLAQCTFTCPTTLNPGDIAITGYNTDGDDQVAFVLLTDITAGTEINFTDRGWLDTNAFRVGNTGREGTLTWTADTAVSCGTQIIIQSANGGTLTIIPNIGTLTETDDFELRANGDQVIAYQGADINPTFIYALNFNDPGWTATAGSQQQSAIPTGLTDGINSIDIAGDDDNGAYNCIVINDPIRILEAISDLTNWNTTDGSGDQSLALALCSFSCDQCLSTATWNGMGWDNIIGPSPSIAAIINGNYDTANNGGSFSTCSLTVNSGTLTINDGNFIEIINDVTVNGGRITTQSQGSFIQRGDGANAGSFTLGASGNADVNKNTSVLNNWFDYTYWSSPVTNTTTNMALSQANPNFRFWFNAANFIDVDGDGIDDDGNAWTRETGSFLMTPGQGFAATNNATGFMPNRSYSFNFSGPYNTGDVTYPVINNTANYQSFHWNLIGNPYPSAIDTDAFFSANSGVIEQVAYLWSQVSPPLGSNPGNEVLNFNQNDYITISTLSVAGNGTDLNGDGIIDNNDVPDRRIPSGQSFFIPSKLPDPIPTSPPATPVLTSQDVIFTNSMRVSGDNTNELFFRNSKGIASKNNINNNETLWLNLSSDIGIYSQISIVYSNISTDDYDGRSIDITRNYAGNAGILYSLITDLNETPFVIQAKSLKNLSADEVVKLGFGAYISTEETYTLDLLKTEGVFFGESSVYLKDNYLKIIHDLKVSNYTFTSPGGTFNDRFEIVFQANTLSTDEAIIEENGLSIIELNDGSVQFTIKNSNLTIETVTIFDMQGRLIYELKGESKSETYNLSNLNSSAYISKVLLSNGQVITQKSIKK